MCIASLMLLSSCATDADVVRSVKEAALMWEASVPFAPPGLRCLDDGSAEVSSTPIGEGSQGLPPTISFDASGRRVRESSWIGMPQSHRSQAVLRESPAKAGYVVLDYGWEECHYEKPDRGRAYPPTPREASRVLGYWQCICGSRSIPSRAQRSHPKSKPVIAPSMSRSLSSHGQREIAETMGYQIRFTLRYTERLVLLG